MRTIFILAIIVMMVPSFAQAGLELENRTQIHIPDLDLDGNGRVTRSELSEYMFFYFDNDGNESLTKGEFHHKRPIAVLPYDPQDLESVDLDHDGQNDPQPYTTETFLKTVMVDKDAAPEAAAEGQIKALRFIDEWFLRLDINDSGAIEPHEWHDEYKMHGVNKPKKRPKAADNNRYN